MTKGRLTGVGVGPGDPELLTLKAVRKIRESDVVVLPVSDRGLEVSVFSGENEREEDGLNNYQNRCVAYQIVKKAVPQVEKKLKMYLPVPMIKEKDRLKKIHDMDADKVCELLEEGKKLVFLTLGDPSVYSTYMYLHKRILKMGYEAEMVPGIPSFCAAASRINDSLAEKEEQIHIIPASYEIGKALELSGTKILMKAGRKLPELKRRLQGRSEKVVMIENCGMENEAVYQGAERIPEEAGYYTLLIMKEEKE